MSTWQGYPPRGCLSEVCRARFPIPSLPSSWVAWASGVGERSGWMSLGEDSGYRMWREVRVFIFIYFFEIGSSCIVQAGLKFLILLSQACATTENTIVNSCMIHSSVIWGREMAAGRNPDRSQKDPSSNPSARSGQVSAAPRGMMPPPVREAHGVVPA